MAMQYPNTPDKEPIMPSHTKKERKKNKKIKESGVSTRSAGGGGTKPPTKPR